MGFEARVTVYSCDDCQRYISVKTDDDWDRFETDWHESDTYAFCPDCRHKPNNAFRINLDKRFAETVFDLFRALAGV